ncbi:NAD(P)-binding domain-containing protein [Intrasporangium sp.]|uniref:NAD(P)-binding domain-containing protein n=1 Tax=Intrasporangium sp. TaxID=1925024 RepID=UPI003221DE18
MSTRVQTLIVGAGQAGLALSACLTRAGHDHLLLEQGRVAQRWHTERWDSFRLLTPNWVNGLPDWPYVGDDPDGFLDRRQVTDFFEQYAASFGAPVRTGVSVTAVRPGRAGWSVQTSAGRYLADNVVVATGHQGEPLTPGLASRLPQGVHQLHTSRYRNPSALPPGGVLVVGSGPSGQQIADELALAGRQVFIAVGRHRPIPRSYRGADVYAWMQRSGMLARTVDTLADPRAALTAPSVVLAGEPEDLNLRRLVRHGVVPVGRLQAVEGPELFFAADLATRLAEADHNVARLREAVDTYITRAGLDVPTEPAPPDSLERWASTPPRRLDLRHDRIGTVLWATGFGRDYSWIHAPVFHADGDPVQRRGVTAADGLYFLGLRWMHRRDSNFIGGVGADAEYLAEFLTDTRDLRATG